MALSVQDFTAPVRPAFERFREQFGGGFDVQRVTNLVFTTPEGERLGFLDVVIEGGGVKGVATLGALYALEEVGLRFRKIAGTSSGALIAAFLAATGRSAAERKAETLIQVLANMDFLSFVDGGSDAQQALQLLFEPALHGQWRSVLNKSRVALVALRNFSEMTEQLGMNPGGRLLTFLCNGLRELHGDKPLTVAALREQWQCDPVRIEGKPLAQDFQVICTDISSRQKVVFPRDLPEYLYRTDEILIGELVRASASIPFFFAPMRLDDFSTDRQNLKAPPYTMFLDGGIVSNFPLSIFDVPSQAEAERTRPQCPTFGLLIDEQLDTPNTVEEIDNPLKLGMAMFLTAMEHGDKSVIKESPHNASRIIRISNTVAPNRKITVVDFAMSDADKITLFANGVRAVLDKLSTWRFGEYVQMYR